MRIGNIYITKAYLGDIQLSPENAFLGIVPVIERQINYLTFSALEDSTLKLTKHSSSAVYPNMEISTNGVGFTPYSQKTVSIPSGTKLYVRGVNTTFTNGGKVTFECTGALNISGELMSLVDGGDGTATEISDGCFQSLFADNTAIISAEDLTISCKNIGEYGLSAMFKNCSNLTKAPKRIEVESSNSEDLYYMFNGCTNLIEAPYVKAYKSGMSNMFAGCTSLTYLNVEFDDVQFNGANLLGASSGVREVYQYGSYRFVRTLLKHELPEKVAVFYMNDGFSFDGNRTFDGNITEATIAMRADSTWNISVDDSQWLGDASQYTIEPLEGNGNTPISVNLKRNMEGERSLILNATSESGETATITITQLEY